MNAVQDILLLQGLILLALVTWNQADQVRIPPSIIAGPLVKHKLYKTGQSYEIPCKATGTPAPEFKWYQDGKQINRDEFIEISAMDGTLRFNEMTGYHAGYYQCTASNYNGVAVSKVIYLQQAVASSFPHQEGAVPYKVTQGKSVQIKCERAKSVPMSETEFSWTVATTIEDLGYPVLLGKRKFVDGNGNLYFAHAELEDQQDKKMYKCNMRNKYLDVIYSGSYSVLTVDPDPNVQPTVPASLFTTGPTQIALLGQDLVMKCFFSGNPDPTLEWKKKNGNLPADRYIKSMDGQMLTIQNVHKEDVGVYICSSHNSAGLSPDVEIAVTIESEPKWTTNGQPASRNATQGDAVSFLCKVDAIPAATVQWYINSEALNPTNAGSGRMISTDGTNLTITNVQKPQDIMNVQCNTSNVHGYEFADAYLNVLLPTVINVSPKNHEIDMNTTEVIFSCNASADVSTPVTVDWFHNNKPITYEPGVIEKLNFSLRINCRGMTPEQRMKLEGEYKALATNFYSRAEATTFVTVKGMPVTPGPVIAAASGFQLWMIALIVAGVLLILLVILCCCIWCQRNRGEEYPVDEKERAQGNDPVKELDDGGFRDYVRPEEAPVKGSRASLNSSIKLDSDDEGSLNEYDMDPTKFNEDGSFIGLYADDLKKRNQDIVSPPPYTAVKLPYTPVSRHMDTDV